MPATTSLRDCSQLVTATLEAGGQAPEVLQNILDGAALLNTRPAPVDPAHTIVKAATDGTLTAEKLDELLVTAASQQSVAGYACELRQRSERMFTEEFHRALKDGAADELLGSMRSVWDAHAAAVGEARSEINSESSAEHILASGSPKLVECWQQLPGHLAALNKIAAVARQFGPRIGNFPLITEFANSDNYRLEDAAIWCADGNLEADSAAFRRPGAQPRQNPLFNTTLRLHTVASAQARYREWAAAQWEQQHSGPMQSWVDEEGKAHEFPRPVNPFAAEADATVG